MWNKKFGKICASLRHDKFNPIEGRVWSQQDLADASGLPVRLIGQIERGERAYLEDDIFECLAAAFNFTALEKRRFLSLKTHSLDEEGAKKTGDYSKVITNMGVEIDAIQQPALLHDGLHRIVAINDSCKKIYGLTQVYFDSAPESDPTKFHLNRLIYDPSSPLRQIYNDQIEAIELQGVVYWKYLSLPYRHTQMFVDIQKKLLVSYPRFAQLWNSLAHEPIEENRVGLLRNLETKHPVFGDLKYAVISNQMDSEIDELFLILLIPTSAKTASAFCALTQH